MLALFVALIGVAVILCGLGMAAPRRVEGPLFMLAAGFGIWASFVLVLIAL